MIPSTITIIECPVGRNLIDFRVLRVLDVVDDLTIVTYSSQLGSIAHTSSGNHQPTFLNPFLSSHWFPPLSPMCAKHDFGDEVDNG